MQHSTQLDVEAILFIEPIEGKKSIAEKYFNKMWYFGENKKNLQNDFCFILIPKNLQQDW